MRDPAEGMSTNDRFAVLDGGRRHQVDALSAVSANRSGPIPLLRGATAGGAIATRRRAPA